LKPCPKGHSLNYRVETSQNASLVFSVTSDKKVKTLTIERSINGIDFAEIKNFEINDYADRNGYNAKDNIAAIRDNIFYYRIKVSGMNGESYYSKVLQLSRNGNDFNTMVSPNPASVSANVTFNSSSASKVEIRLFNTQGQLVRINSIMSTSGINTVHVNGLDQLPAGIYNVSVTYAGKTSHTKLVIQH
ncbi:MAG: T9SS type A sorting domain-containing protein, partial [Panacibacter sp.]